MNYRTLFFDLDDTLYQPSSGLWEAIRVRMETYMHDRMGIDWKDIRPLRTHYFETYGTTLRGLQVNFNINTDEYLSYVHDLPLDQYLDPNPALRDMLVSLPQRLWIFTNADSDHARRVLKALELEACFLGIIDIRALEFISKPNPQAYVTALKISGETDPKRCVFFDDSNRNLIPAHKIGFQTVMVGADGARPKADLAVQTILDLPIKFPELWNEGP
jgi:pyrimidine 5'-nucleotidase